MKSVFNILHCFSDWWAASLGAITGRGVHDHEGTCDVHPKTDSDS